MTALSRYATRAALRSRGEPSLPGSARTLLRGLHGAAIALALCASPAHSAVLESFRYPNAAAVTSAWRAIGTAPAAQPAPDGVVFPCPFDGAVERAYWDRDVPLDLSAYTTFELDVTCEDPASIRTLALYFRSGSGWYIWSKPLREAGRQRVVLHKQDFSSEGTPAGWERIDRIRLSPWKGAPERTRLVAHALAARRDDLFVVAATLSAKDPAERALSARVAARVSAWLRNAGLRHAVIAEDDLVASGPGAARVLILPYSPQPPAAVVSALRRFVDQGGKLIVCYSESEALAALMGVALGAYQQSREPGRWSAMVFDDPAAWRVPARVHQQSWNIRVVKPRKGRGQVIARWANAAGQVHDEPAWVATDRGLWMTHVLLDDDRANKERMLVGLIGRYDPSAWADAARHAVQTAGKIDDFPGLDAAVAGIRSLARAGAQRDEVERLLARAQASVALAQQREAAGAYAEALAAADQARDALTEAYSRAQPPRAGEFRGVWDHDGVGWYPGDWDRTCRLLREHGVNAIFPNVLWAGLAHYPSKVVPGSNTLKLFGDQMKASLAAARRHGLQVHAWKVCWQVEQAPPEFVARLKKEGRLQQGADGKTINWMNPAVAANVRQELDAVEELARNYAVDGIHLDYVRFPGANACFAPATQRAFGAWLGGTLGPWPASVRDGPRQGEFRRWRARLITDFVREARKRVKAVRPDLQFSVAVWGGYPEIIDSIGQDWGAWLRDGTVDFVCPMNYTEEQFRFAALLEKQLKLPGSRGRVYPGIGVTASESQLQPDQVIEQIATLRRLGANGFMLFDLSQTLRMETLPALGKGVTGDGELE